MEAARGVIEGGSEAAMASWTEAAAVVVAAADVVVAAPAAAGAHDLELRLR